MRRQACIALLVMSLAAAPGASAEDWPHWRGPNGDGISRETGLLQEWPEAFKPVWAAEVGVGFASPIARDGKVFLYSFIDGRDRLTCYDAETGSEIWSESDPTGWSGLYSGTRATPRIEGDRIYTYGGVGDLTARDVASGKTVWHLNVLKETDAVPIRYAQASNPLIVGDLIYVQGGWGKPIPRSATRSATAPAPPPPPTTTTSAATKPVTTAPTRFSVPVAVAVDKYTGKIVWRADFPGTASYAGIVHIDVEGRKQLVVFTSEGPVGIDPATGKTIWHEPWIANSYGNCTDPIYRDGHLFISSFNQQGCMMLKLSANGGVQRVWENKDTACRFQPPILEGDALYLNSEGTLKCFKWPTSDVRWESPKGDKNLLNFGGSILRIPGERMILLSQNGRLTLAKATPERFERITSIPDVVEGRQVWATPLIYKGRLYVKGENEFVCLDIREK